MRNIPASLAAELGKTVTSPFYLVRLGYNDTSVGYYTTGSPVWFQSDMDTAPAWYSGTVKISGVNSDKTSISILNTDLSASGIVLNQDLSDATVEVYKVYPAGHGDTVTINNAVKLFCGRADNPSKIGLDWVVIPAYSDSRRLSWTPRIFATPPVFNHLIPGGTVINGVELEPNDG